MASFLIEEIKMFAPTQFIKDLVNEGIEGIYYNFGQEVGEWGVWIEGEPLKFVEGYGWEIPDEWWERISEYEY